MPHGNTKPDHQGQFWFHGARKGSLQVKVPTPLPRCSARTTNHSLVSLRFAQPLASISAAPPNPCGMVLMATAKMKASETCGECQRQSQRCDRTFAIVSCLVAAASNFFGRVAVSLCLRLLAFVA